MNRLANRIGIRGWMVGLLVAMLGWIGTPVLHAAEPFRFPEGKHGRSELKRINNVPVLILQGTPEEIGEAYGTLAVKPASILVDAVPDLVVLLKLQKRYGEVIEHGTTLLSHTTPAHQAELAAAAKAANRKPELFTFANTLADLYKIGGCSTIVVESSRSKTGGPLFGRNLDWPPFRNLGEHTLVTVFKPEGKHAFAAVTLPALMGVISGINDAGLSITLNEIKKAGDNSPKLDLDGVPLAFLLRRVMEECTTVEEAEKLLRTTKRTTYGNLTVCDRNGGAVIEITPKTVNVRKAVNEVCICTNHFRTDGLAEPAKCWRFDALQKTQNASDKLGVPDVIKNLDNVNQWVWTMQSMVFEPKERILHVSFTSTGSATGKPFGEVKLGPIFDQLNAAK
ncbi:C45 family autoproteolytic acyltransferase/hydolase [Tuwongella immobilis]|uniref:Peptidase C45 hydrolase domain-containing protein n=1 Tax=Tuwongella immobilis TaxID=692036 RepID=A0A6C2YR62_9BACT|nr:C45 family peptidase [Tuwongella immobilis]VIP03847.1 acyl- :6-aminopenicillanic acid acyl-transferase : Choloylglycine hydrolase OS=uncultured planctomycete GN=HGMM_F11G08C07 PE=4 SV=1: AAT [Tuwongella immobilis]VTS05061.1 acyl- :6-aminopenicillanic acid acyl-transferase : Choloylglycine hydrolase OS=uncultured planctomycete GN=HGMM_F11G08C07 PE=4 SV=1: AAT [Tuwongella immobilis]